MYLTAFVPEALVDAIPPKLASAPGSRIFTIQNIKLTVLFKDTKTPFCIIMLKLEWASYIKIYYNLQFLSPNG